MASFKDKYSVIIPRLDGGLNNRVSPLLGDLTQSPDLQNVEFDEFGAVGTVSGTTAAFNAIGSAKVDGLFGLDVPTTNQLIAVCNNMVLRASGNTFVTIPSGQSIYTVGERVNAEQMNNVLFLSNGYANPYKYNGTEFTRWGVAVNSAPVSIYTNGATTYMVSGGAYQYVFFGISTAGAYGDYSSGTTEYTNVNGVNININGIPTYPISYGVNNIGIARNTAGASGVFWVVTQITNGVTAYTDTAADGDLSTAAPLDNGEPDKFTVHASFLGRMFGANANSDNPEYLSYSEINEPETFPAANIVRIGPGDGAAIRSIGVMQNGIVIGKDDGKGNGSMWYLFQPTSTPGDWMLKKIPSPYGSIMQSKLPNYGNLVAYMNKYGIYDINETEVNLLKTDAISFDMKEDVDNFNEDFLDGVYAVNFKNKVWFSIPYGSNTENSHIYTYDYVKGKGLVTRKAAAWSKQPDMNINTLAVHQGKLYGGSTLEDGVVYQLDKGANYNGSAIDSYYWTMAIKGTKAHEAHTKMWRYAVVTVSTSGAWNLTVDYLALDNTEGIKSTTIDLTPGGAVWDSAVFGTDTWGRQIEEKKVKITFDASTVGVYLQMRFRTATADQYFKVHNCEVFYNLKGVR